MRAVRFCSRVRCWLLALALALAQQDGACCGASLLMLAEMCLEEGGEGGRERGRERRPEE